MPGLTQSKILPQGRGIDDLTKEERERIVEPYLPSLSSTRGPVRLGDSPVGNLRSDTPYHPSHLLSFAVHHFLYLMVHLVFSIYIRARQAYHAILDRLFAILYYHHRTPELIQRDLRGLSRLPRHLSVIVDLEGRSGSGIASEESLAKLVADIAELSAWCMCAGIPMLSVYERTDELKSHVPSLHKAISAMSRLYFPPSSTPNLHIRAPHHAAYSPPSSPSLPPTASTHTPSLNVLLLSASDGRATLVDLTKTLTEMSQRGKLAPEDVCAELIDAELTESSCGEPDLLVVMAPSNYGTRRKTKRRSPRYGQPGKRAANGESLIDTTLPRTSGVGGDVCLVGYPPWQVRLTEISYVQDNSGVEYQVFLRALHRYAKAEIRFGR